MSSRRVVVTIAAAACCVAALFHQRASANDTSTGFDNDDALSRPVTIPLNAASPPRVPARIKAPATDQPATGNPLWGIPIKALHATREHPLFSPSRRPPMPAVISQPVEAVKTRPAAPETTLNLLGIVEGDGEGYAVFINTTTHDIVRLETGEGEGGWVLRSVSGREAVLEKNDRTEVLELPPITGVSK